jgi:acyl-CoA synthetase (AMP-forming)/AMP-acid ligase II
VRGLPLPPRIGLRTIPDVLLRRVEEDPDAPAVTVRSGGRAPSTLTRAELSSLAAAAAAGLQRRGVGAGDRVAWLLDNEEGLEALVLYHATVALGAVNVPINTRLAPPEVGQIIDHSASEIVVVGARHRDRLAAVRSDGAVSVIEVDAHGDVLGALLDPRPCDPHQPHDADPANLLYTSGTTGRPKGVLHTHGSSIAAGLSWSDAFRLTPGDVLQSPFPIFSGAGLHFNALSSLWAGAHVVIDGTDVDVALAGIAETGATVYVAVPSIYSYWLDSPVLGAVDLSTLRILDYGGASMPPVVIERLRAALPSAGLVQSYGLTEAGPGGTYLPEQFATARLGSIGAAGAGPFTSVRVVDGEGRDVPAGQLGELVLRGPSIMDGYHRDGTATADAFFDGWLRSGDLVRSDDEGFLFHVDRIKDLIVRGGFNIGSIEVEAVLARHPGVAEVAVFGVPHPTLGEDVAAAVAPRPGHTLDVEELVEHCRASLAAFKCPRRVVVVEPLPRNAAGKVDKRRLRTEHS